MAAVQRRTYFRILLATIGAIIALVIALSVALRSPVVMSRILPPVQNMLRNDFNIDSKIGALSIDLLGRVSLKQFRARWDDPQLGTADLSVESVTLRFSIFQLLRRNLQVSSVEMTQPKIALKLSLPESKPDEKSPENPLTLIRQLIESPPVALQVDLVSVERAEIDIQINDKQGELRLYAGDFNFKATVLTKAKSLRAALELSTFSKGQNKSGEPSLSLSMRGFVAGLQSAELQTQLKLEARTGFELNFTESASPRLDIDSIEIASLFKALTLKVNAEHKDRASIESKDLQAKISMSKRATLNLKKIFELEKVSGPEFVERIGDTLFQSLTDFNFAVQQDISWKELNVSAQLLKTKSDVEIRSQAGIEAELRVTDSEILLNTQGSGLDVVVTKLKARMPALNALTEFIQLNHLTFLQLKSPLSLTLSKPSFESLTEPLKGLRVAGLSVSPQLLINNKSTPVVGSQIKLNHELNGRVAMTVDAGLTLIEELILPFPALSQLVSEAGLLQLASNISLTSETNSEDIHRLLSSPESKKSDLKFEYGLRISQTRQPPQGSKLALNLIDGIEVSGAGRVSQMLNLSAAELSTVLNIGKVPFADLKINLENKPKMLSASGKAQLSVPLSIREASPVLSDLSKLGGLRVDAQWGFQLPHSQSSMLKVDFSKIEKLKPTLTLKGQINFSEKPTEPIFEQQTLQVGGPINVASTVALKSRRLELATNFAVPQIGTNALLLVNGINGKAQIDTTLPFQNVFKLTMNTAVSELNPDKSLGLPPELLPYLKSVEARVAAKVDMAGAAEIESVDLSTGKDLLFLKAQGGSDLNVENSRFSGQIDLKLPPTFRYGIRSEDKVDFGGRVRADWEATQKALKTLRLRGMLNLDNFSARHSLAEVEKVRGSVPFEQMLETSDLKSIRWSYLISDNPFKRVDTSKFTPLTADDSLFTADHLSVLGRKFGPLRARVSLKQNMLNIDKLDADLFEGVLAGQAYVDIQPSKFTTGIQGRITKLNTSLLAKTEKRQPPAPLSARMSLMVDLSRSLIEGRADVTEIGKNQLLALIDVLDPDGTDALLNKARLGLGVGYPRYVGLMMQNGFLDLSVALGGAVEQNIDISNLPLSPIVNAKTQDIVKVMREVPIQ